MGSTQERHQLLCALHELLTGVARARPTLVVLEDLHWSDDATLDFLLFFARRMADLPIVVLLSCRVDGPDPSLHHVPAELDRQRLAIEASLAPVLRRGGAQD